MEEEKWIKPRSAHRQNNKKNIFFSFFVGKDETEIIDLGQKLALHMMNEDALFEEILNSYPTEEEAVFLSQMIFRKGSITKAWEKY